jgi:hypothetical protein
MLSVTDDDAPIKVQLSLNNIAEMLNEENDNNEDDDLTEFESWQAEEQAKTKRKTKYARHKEDAGLIDYYSKYQRERTREKNPLYDVSHELKSAAKYRKEDYVPATLSKENFNIDEYLDTKITQNAHMTNQIKSTLSRLDNKLGKRKSVISEHNASGEKSEKT